MKNFKKELSVMYEKDYGVHLSPDKQIISTIGSKEGISHLCLAVTGPGDRVIVPAPYFPIHVYAPVIAGAEVTTVPLGTEESLLRNIHDRCTVSSQVPRLLILNFPHNPTGAIVSRGFFQEIVTLAKAKGFMVLHDFAYSKIVFDGEKAPSFLEIPGACDIGVEFGSFSKTYNMAGWRIGYCAGNEKLISALKQIKMYYDYGIFSAIQVAGITALRSCDDEIRKQVGVYQERRDILCSGLEQIGWETPKPPAGMFVWAKIPERIMKAYENDTMKVALALLDKSGVVVSPGSGFGNEGEGFFRIAFVENKQRLRQAIRQIGRYF
jgi:alanine-synthesizing transaminase